MSWNYRVVKTIGTFGLIQGLAGQTWASYGVHEVHYDGNGEPASMTKESVSPGGETALDFISSFSDYRHAFCKPVLIFNSDTGKFSGEEEKLFIPPLVCEWKKVQADVYQIALSHGWWDEPRSVGDIIALMHSELSEALEGARHDNPPSDHIPEFSSLEEEFADVVIRIMDYAGRENLRVVEAMLAKIEFNRSREYKHGGKKF